MSSAWRSLRFPLYLIAATLVLLELTLQLGALGIWWLGHRQIAAAAATNEPTILCVGDSWTHGMGSTDPSERSYPSVLERELGPAPDGSRWHVANGGLSGQNSREVLDRLAGQLTHYRPRLVMVLVGANDYWSTPALLEPESGGIEPGAFRWRFRVLRAVDWLVGKWSPGEATEVSEEPDPYTGEEWAPRVVQSETPYPYPDSPWFTDKDAQRLRREAASLRKTGRSAEATAVFEQALARHPDDMLARKELTRLCFERGSLEEAATHVDRLHRQFDTAPGPIVAASLAHGLNVIGRHEQGLRLVTDFVERWPKSAELWYYKALFEFFAGSVDRAVDAIDQALARQKAPWFFFWRARFHAAGRGDIDEALRTLVQGYLFWNDASWLEINLRTHAKHDADELARYRRLLDSMALDAALRRRLEVIGARALRPDTGVDAILIAHLERIVTMCRSHGAEPVILTYPVRIPAGSVGRRVAARMPVPSLDVEAHFRAVLRNRQWDELRAADGHCNDEGYRIMAQFLASALRVRVLNWDTSELVGDWFVAGANQVLSLRDTGHGSLGDKPLQWHTLDDTLVLEIGPSVFMLGWHKLDAQLELTLAGQHLTLHRL